VSSEQIYLQVPPKVLTTA